MSVTDVLDITVRDKIRTITIIYGREKNQKQSPNEKMNKQKIKTVLQMIKITKKKIFWLKNKVT